MRHHATSSTVDDRRNSAAQFALAILLAGLAWAAAAPVARVRAANAADDAQEARIQKLILELGSDQFPIRTRAQAELERIGVPAFDALDEAKDHDDVEVALRVRYLLRMLSANWAQDDDPPEVKAVLKAYGEQVDAERRTRMERLAAYNHVHAISALSRLARFETNPALSKHAAILAMSVGPPKSDAERAVYSQAIRAVAGNSRRPAIAWLRLYAQTMENAPATFAPWQDVVQAELQEFSAMSPRTSSAVMRDLLRWHVDFLRTQQQEADALRSAEQLIQVVDGTPAELSELVAWFMERKLWTLVQQLAERFPEEFNRSPVLVYRRAESLARQDRQAEADMLADQAYQALPDSAAPHLEMAIELKDRGLFKWSEREFRRVLEFTAAGDLDEIRTRYRFSEMLFDLDRPLEAANIWQEFSDRLEKDPAMRDRLAESRQLYRARMHYFRAKHHMSQQEWPEVRKELDQALLNDPNDADVLIAKHRLPNADEEWKRKTAAQIKTSADHFLELIRHYEALVDNPQVAADRDVIVENLANSCNQYAWLVGNTDGDVDEAIRLSHRSIELMPKTGSYLDTLAHCYFAKKDYANAVKYQTLAAQRDPHSLQIQRQLKVFQAALQSAAP
ncbi:MAG: hypothetical protein U0939_02515 [Pirellulales bacterium]